MSFWALLLPKKRFHQGVGGGSPPLPRPLLNRLAGPTTWALILLVLWVPALVLVYFLWPTPVAATTQLTYNGPALVFRVQDVGELTTLRYEIQKIVTASQHDFEVLGLPVSSEKLALITYLTADFRYDLTQVRPEDVLVEGQAPDQIVRIKLPPPQLAVSLDTQKTVVYQHSADFAKRLLNRNDPHFETWLRQVAESETKIALKNGDGADKSRRNAEVLLLGLFKNLGVSAVHIETVSRGPADRVRFVESAPLTPVSPQ